MNKKLFLTVLCLGFGTYLLFSLVGFSKRVGPAVSTMPSLLPDATISKSVPGSEINLMYTEPNVGRKMIAPPPSTGGGSSLDEANRLTRKYSNTSVVTRTVSQYLADMTTYVESIGGRVMSSSVNKSQKYDYGYLTLRVPADRFTAVNTKVTENVDSVYSQQMSNEDETGTYTSQLNARTKLDNQLKTKQASLVTAKTDVEKKKLQQEIADLEERIAYYDQMIRNVKEQNDYAMVTVTAASSERYYTGMTSAPESTKEMFLFAVLVLGGILRFLLGVAIWVAVFSVLWLPVVLVLGLLKRRKNTPVVAPFPPVSPSVAKPISLASPAKPKRASRPRVRVQK